MDWIFVARFIFSTLACIGTFVVLRYVIKGTRRVVGAIADEIGRAAIRQLGPKAEERVEELEEENFRLREEVRSLTEEIKALKERGYRAKVLS